MKIPLWTVLLLSLCVSGHSDCQGDCLTCGLILPEHHAFNTLVCIVQCEAQTSPASSWDSCLNQPLRQLQEEETSKRSADGEEPVATLSVEKDGGVEYSEALERFRHAQEINAHKLISYQPDLHLRTEEDEDEDGGASRQDDDGAVSVAKRFGGFMKGRHGFRKLVSSGRPLQKRYGGFIGIRKSARKWNNQKRVSQLLRQYLSLTGRSGPTGRMRI